MKSPNKPNKLNEPYELNRPNKLRLYLYLCLYLCHCLYLYLLRRCPMPRGGRRPGAGAPKRNFNALKTGSYTPRLYLLALYLLANPFIRMCYKQICANLIKQGLFSKPVGAGQHGNLKNQTNPMNSTNPIPSRGFIAVFVDGKCRRLYLAPKNKKIQSNFIFFINTKNWGPDRNNQTTPPAQSSLPTLGRD